MYSQNVAFKIPLRLSISIIIIGALFKIMHWPYANVILFSSLIIFMLIFIPIYFIIKYREPESRFSAIINTTFMVGAAGMLFALINLQYVSNTNSNQNQEMDFGMAVQHAAENH